jgi:ribonuclease HI
MAAFFVEAKPRQRGLASWYNLIHMQSNIIIFTDGASSGNPGPGGWGTLVSYEGKVSELGGGEERTTNNRMELQAVLEGLSFVIEQGVSNIPITLYTDSSYVSNGITTWIKGWQKRNWTNQAGDQIANVDLWKKMGEVLKDVSVKTVQISGHSGIPGNERVDEIATGYIKEDKVYLYHGPLDGYTVDILNTKVDPTLKKEKDRKKGKAYSYLSLIGKDLQIHYTWDECKKRVEGQKGAKYKKSLSPEDEEKIKRSWGIK